MSALYLDCSDWGRIRVRGGDRVRFLQGLTTVNVEALQPGAHGWGAILNPKGRVLSVIDVEQPAGDTESLVIHCEASLTDKTRALLERYAVMDDVEFTLETGPCHRVWADPDAVWTAPPILAPAPEHSDPAALEACRVRAGMLRYGVDVDEDAFPFETRLAEFLDYGKGCYVGQEPVFRVHAQGNAARRLCGLVFHRHGGGTTDVEPAPGATVVHPSKSNAGAITSIARDPDLGVIALAYLHRTAWRPGDEVTVGELEATVCAPPF